MLLFSFEVLPCMLLFSFDVVSLTVSDGVSRPSPFPFAEISSRGESTSSLTMFVMSASGLRRALKIFLGLGGP